MLVMFQSDWPAADGNSGITSAKVMDDAEAAGRAIEVGSNFFLFFSSEQASVSASAHAMHTHPAAQGSVLRGIGSALAANVGLVK